MHYSSTKPLSFSPKWRAGVHVLETFCSFLGMGLLEAVVIGSAGASLLSRTLCYCELNLLYRPHTDTRLYTVQSTGRIRNFTSIWELICADFVLCTHSSEPLFPPTPSAFLIPMHFSHPLNSKLNPTEAPRLAAQIRWYSQFVLSPLQTDATV